MEAIKKRAQIVSSPSILCVFPDALFSESVDGPSRWEQANTGPAALQQRYLFVFMPVYRLKL